MDGRQGISAQKWTDEQVVEIQFGGEKWMKDPRYQYNRMRLLATNPPSIASMLRTAMRSAL